MTTKGAEDKRRYMLTNHRVGAPTATTPSTLFFQSPREIARAHETLSDSNSVPQEEIMSTTSHDEKSVTTPLAEPTTTFLRTTCFLRTIRFFLTTRFFLRTTRVVEVAALRRLVTRILRVVALRRACCAR